MARRDRIDPETARLVQQRLQWLLSENGPRPESMVVHSDHGTDTPDGASSSADEDAPGVTPGGASNRRRRPSTRSRPGADERRDGASSDEQLDDGGLPDARRERVGRPAARPALPRVGVAAAAVHAAAASFRRPHVVIVGVVVALGILVAGWAVLRARPVAIAVTPPPVAATRTAPPASGESGPAASPSPSAPSLVVHVLGAVRKPGLVSLASGSRVQDALDAAGGLTGRADPGQLNLAQPVADGQQILVGTKAKPSGQVRDGSNGAGAGSGSAAGSSGGGGGAVGAGQPTNLNTASQAQLEELPGVGPVMAGKIIAWRTEHGRFSRVEELQEIDGVGPKTYAKLAPLCQV